jgi:hypothetical protein
VVTSGQPRLSGLPRHVVRGLDDRHAGARLHNAAAVAFHQANIGPILKVFGPLMGASPQTVIRPVFVAAP